MAFNREDGNLSDTSSDEVLTHGVSHVPRKISAASSSKAFATSWSALQGMENISLHLPSPKQCHVLLAVILI